MDETQYILSWSSFKCIRRSYSRSYCFYVRLSYFIDALMVLCLIIDGWIVNSRYNWQYNLIEAVNIENAQTHPIRDSIFNHNFIIMHPSTSISFTRIDLN